jgi:hypothetical protein
MSIHFKKNVCINKKLLILILATAVISLSAIQIPSRREESILVNSYFAIEFNIQTGILSVFRANGQPFISGAICGIHTGSENRITTTSNYYYSVKKIPISNDVGAGSMLKITGQDKKKMLDIEILVSIYDNLHAIVFEMLCKNVSGNDMVINSIEPIRMIKAESGSLFYPNVQKCLTNGAMYYDAGTIHILGSPYKKPEPYGETKGGVMKNDIFSTDDETVQSWWNLGLFSGYNHEGISLGYIENRIGLGRLQLLKTDADQLSFVAESVFNPGFKLKPGKTISSDRFMINLAEDPYKSLEDYALIINKINQGRTNSIVNGWCNWFYTLDHYDENEIIRNAEFASRHLKPYGLEYIQIDEGYQTSHGDWNGNARFPHGMKWLAEKIKSYGLKPGIWISPFVVSDTTSVFKQHPDWFLKNEDGTLKRIGPWPNENTDWFRYESPKRYGLDLTHPGAEKWFTDLIDTLVNNWGFEMIKIDFVAWTVFSAHHFYDPSYTPSQVYRKAFEIIRNVSGEKCHLLDCGPGNVTVGMINSMRIEYDQNYGYGNDVWKQYFIGSSCSAGAAGKRYYYHNTAWVNDADHVCIDLLSIQQSQAAASLIALTGGNTMSGDRLFTLDASKLEILKKIFPSTGINGKPVDLWDSEIQTVFAASFKKNFDEWTVIGFFNPDLMERVIKKFPIERLWLNPDKTYLCYDFWKEQFLGEVSKDVQVKLDPGSVTLLSIHEKKDVPQFISTTRHVMQGAIEIENTGFDSSTRTLYGTSLGPEGSTHSVIVYVPDNYQWSPHQNKLYDDFENYIIKMVDQNILRIQLKFENSEKINWKVIFEKIK